MSDDIRVKEFEFPSSNTYYTIHGKMWIPKHDVIAVVQISHGMAEHIDRYDEFARFLAERQILVIGNDHMGHGKSINSEEDLGYFSIPFIGAKGKDKEKYTSSSLAVQDLRYITKVVKKHYPGVPYILLGQSMGSFLARRYMMEYGREIDGAILMGTGNPPYKEVLLGKILCGLISKIKGDRHRSKLLYLLMFGTYNKRIKKPVGKNAWITSDNERIKLYNQDKKCGYIFTVNGIKALFSTILFVEKESNIAKIPKDIKTLLISGSDDPVGGYTKQVKEVYEQYKKHGMEDISVKFYEESRHELINEKVREYVFKDIDEWICEHTVR